MNQNDIKKVKNHSLNITEENRKKIGELFPEVITESVNQNGECIHAIDFEKLKQLLSDSLVDERERYEFTWVGKNEAILEAGQPIKKTLRPQKDKSVDWDNTENVYIEGDNLEVLKLLQESYLNKIDVIYIDPPYNTGNDFIYNDDFRMSQEEYSEAIGEFDEYNQRMKPSKKDNARFHSDWLNMMYSRLKLARNLLSDKGVIFISIDDNEQAHLKEICDEIFGEQNFIANIIQKSRTGISNDKIISSNHNILLFYSKNIKIIESNRHKFGIKRDKSDFKTYTKNDNDGRGEYKLNPVTGPGGARKGNPYYEFLGIKNYWRFSKETMQKMYDENRIVKNNNNLYQKTYKKDLIDKKKGASTWWDSVGTTSDGSKELKKYFKKIIFDFPKPTSLIKYILNFIDYKEGYILDFFSGSGTTADAVMQLNAEDGGNRKFIMVQLPEKIDEKQEAYKEGYRYITEIGEERIRRAGAKVKKEHPEVDTGFRVFKVDSSNMEETYKSPNKVSQQNLLDDIRNVKEDRNDLDLLYQVMLDWGLELSLPYESEIIEETIVHNVFDGALIACFTDDLNEQLIRKIAEKEPFRVVFKDASFKDSAMKTNVVEIFKEISPETKIKVI